MAPGSRQPDTLACSEIIGDKREDFLAPSYRRQRIHNSFAASEFPHYSILQKRAGIKGEIEFSSANDSVERKCNSQRRRWRR